MKRLLNLFFQANAEQLPSALKRGALLIDVRSPTEFASGSLAGAVNIPLDRIPAQIDRMRATGKSLICFCRSGMRSAKATEILRSAGIEAINGGSIHRMNRQLAQA